MVFYFFYHSPTAFRDPSIEETHWNWNTLLWWDTGSIFVKERLRSRELCKHGHSKYRVNVPEIVMHLQIWWRRNSLVHGSNNIGTGNRRAVGFSEGEFIQIFRVYSFLLSALGQFQKSLWLYYSHRYKIFLRYPFKNVYSCMISLLHICILLVLICNEKINKATLS